MTGRSRIIDPGIVWHDPFAADRYATAREALATLPHAVVLIGAASDADRSCATGTAMYVSFAPPRFAIALHSGSRTHALVTTSRRFSISVMTDDLLELAARAGRSARTTDKFAELEADVQLGPNQTPALAKASARVWCVVVDEYVVGDHRLVIGEVEAWSTDQRPVQRPALVRHRRRYAAVGPWLSDVAPEGYPT